MGNLRFKIYFYLSIAAIVAIFMLVPRGTTVLNTSISLAPDGKPVFTAIADKKGAFSKNDKQLARNILTQGIYGQSFEKADYGFVVYYRFFYRFDLTSVPSYVPAQLVFSADLPGDITKVKDGNIEDSKAFWILDRGKNGDFYAESKAVRWWLVVLSIAIAIFVAYIIYVTYVAKQSLPGERKKRGHS